MIYFQTIGIIIWYYICYVIIMLLFEVKVKSITKYAFTSVAIPAYGRVVIFYLFHPGFNWKPFNLEVRTVTVSAAVTKSFIYVNMSFLIWPIIPWWILVALNKLATQRLPTPIRDHIYFTAISPIFSDGVTIILVHEYLWNYIHTFNGGLSVQN